MTKNSHNKTFTYPGLLSIGAIYLILLMVLVVVFAVMSFDIVVFWVLAGILTTICVIIAIAIYLFSRHIEKTDEQTKIKLKNGDFQEPKRGNF